MGRYRPRVEPKWSHFVWRTELITGLYENVAVPWLLHWLAGTPFHARGLRLFGARIGRRVYLGDDLPDGVRSRPRRRRRGGRRARRRCKRICSRTA